MSHSGAKNARSVSTLFRRFRRMPAGFFQGFLSKPFQHEQKTDPVIEWQVCRNGTFAPRGAKQVADKKQPREKKRIFPGNRTIFPERNDLTCVESCRLLPTCRMIDYGSLLVIFDREFSMAVRSAG